LEAVVVAGGWVSEYERAREESLLSLSLSLLGEPSAIALEVVGVEVGAVELSGNWSDASVGSTVMCWSTWWVMATASWVQNALDVLVL